MDSESITMDFLLTSLRAETSWDADQKVIFWVYDSRSGEDVLLDSDSQLADVIEMYKQERRFILLASVFDKEVCDPICVMQPEIDKTLPSNVEEGNPSPLLLSNAQEGNPTPLLPSNAQGGHHTFVSNEAGCEQTADVEADEDDSSLPDVFDTFEEYVGVDDEYMYGVEPSAANDTTRSADYNETTPHPARGVVPEPEVNDADPQVISVLHNPENLTLENILCFLT